MKSAPRRLTGPDEAHHELGLRMVVQIPGRAGLLDPAVVHDHDLLGDVHRLLLVVGDEDGRHVDLLVEAAKPHSQLLANVRVERPEGLVEEQHLGLDGERPGERHALALPARELGRVAIGESVEMDELQELLHPLVDLLLRPLADRQPEGDVVLHGHVLEGGVVLEHEADAAVLDRDVGGVAVGDHDSTPVGLLEPGDHAQERRLPAAARTEQRRQRAVRHIDRDPVQGDEVAELLPYSVNRDAHQAASFLLKLFIATSVDTAIRASTRDAV